MREKEHQALQYVVVYVEYVVYVGHPHIELQLIRKIRQTLAHDTAIPARSESSILTNSWISQAIQSLAYDTGPMIVEPLPAPAPVIRSRLDRLPHPWEVSIGRNGT